MFWYHWRAYRLMPATTAKSVSVFVHIIKVFFCCNFAYFHFVHNGNFTEESILDFLSIFLVLVEH